MDDKRKAWHTQFGSNFGAREYIRFSCVFILWMFLGVALSILLRSSTPILIFMFITFGFAVVATRWKPAYSFLRIILNNENLPAEPLPFIRTKSLQPRQWWSYLPGLWWLLIDLILLYAVIKYFWK